MLFLDLLYQERLPAVLAFPRPLDTYNKNHALRFSHSSLHGSNCRPPASNPYITRISFRLMSRTPVRALSLFGTWSTRSVYDAWDGACGGEGLRVRWGVERARTTGSKSLTGDKLLHAQHLPNLTGMYRLSTARDSPTRWNFC